MSYKNSKIKIWFNKQKIKKGHKIYCKNCCKRKTHWNDEVNECLAYPHDCEDTWFERTCEYKSCADINRNNDCLEFDEITYY